jgi:hypothetical protein
LAAFHGDPPQVVGRVQHLDDGFNVPHGFGQPQGFGFVFEYLPA